MGGKAKAKKKVKAGGIVSSMVSIDDILRKSEILKSSLIGPIKTDITFLSIKDKI